MTTSLYKTGTKGERFNFVDTGIPRKVQRYSLGKPYDHAIDIQFERSSTLYYVEITKEELKKLCKMLDMVAMDISEVKQIYNLVKGEIAQVFLEPSDGHHLPQNPTPPTPAEV